MILQYIRHPRKQGSIKILQPVGVFIADKTAEGIKVGWSLCNKRDVFRKAMGLTIAKGRMDKLNIKIEESEQNSVVIDWQKEHLPQKIHSDFEFFVKRAKRYFFPKPKSLAEKIIHDNPGTKEY